jgi:hypothetical protein
MAPALEVSIAASSGVAASTKKPWPDAPKNASVVDCVEPVTGALTFTYRALRPVAVGVSVNVTTPVTLSYAVTVPFATCVLDVFMKTAMFAITKFAVLDPEIVAVWVPVVVPTEYVADCESDELEMLDGSGYAITLRGTDELNKVPSAPSGLTARTNT